MRVRSPPSEVRIEYSPFRLGSSTPKVSQVRRSPSVDQAPPQNASNAGRVAGACGARRWPRSRSGLPCRRHSRTRRPPCRPATTAALLRAPRTGAGHRSRRGAPCRCPPRLRSFPGSRRWNTIGPGGPDGASTVVSSRPPQSSSPRRPPQGHRNRRRPPGQPRWPAIAKIARCRGVRMPPSRQIAPDSGEDAAMSMQGGASPTPLQGGVERVEHRRPAWVGAVGAPPQAVHGVPERHPGVGVDDAERAAAAVVAVGARRRARRATPGSCARTRARTPWAAPSRGRRPRTWHRPNSVDQRGRRQREVARGAPAASTP